VRSWFRSASPMRRSACWRGRRPSVTTALGALTKRGALERREDGTWLLHGLPPAGAED
jgi:hypothetical protein